MNERRENQRLRWVLLAKAGAGLALGVALAGGFWLRAHGLDIGDLGTAANELGGAGAPRFAWRSVDRKHWQAVGPSGGLVPASFEGSDVTDEREANAAGCRAGMVRVKGNYRNENRGEPTGEIERLQDAACTDWISKEFPARCRTFDAAKIAASVATIPTKPLDFCMDRFEYPNVLGQNPVIVVTYREAESMCKQSKKRLCNETEWTFACEGEEVRPYPYGYTRDASACVVDRDWRPFKEGALQPRDGQGAERELDRLWQAEPSGSRAACKSPFGVYDMTGNVDEWTRTARSKGYASVLKGGYWGPVRARCRPATRAHNEDFVAYQQGFRCCSEADASIAAPRPGTMYASGAGSAGDAGGAPAEALGPRGSDAGSPAVAGVADLSPEWESRSASRFETDEGDEGEAIGRARVALRCEASSSAAAAAVGSSSGPGVAHAFAVLVALAVLRGRHGRRRRSAAGLGTEDASLP